MRKTQFEDSLAEAKLYPQIWRLFAGIGVVLLVWLGTTLVVFGVYGAVIAQRRGPLPVLSELTSLSNPVDAGQVILLLSTFIGLFLGVLVATAALHFRDPASLFGPLRTWWQGFYKVLVVLIPVYGTLLAFSFAGDAPSPVLDPKTWAMLLPVTAALIFIQTGAEELLFRGYLQQQLAARFRGRFVWMWIPSIIFGLMHWSPLAGENLPLVLLAAFTFGMIAADLTERTGSLGAAMGFHFGNNFVGLAILASSEQMSGLALFAGSSDVAQAGPSSLGMVVSIFAMLTVWGVTAMVLDRRG